MHPDDLRQLARFAAQAGAPTHLVRGAFAQADAMREAVFIRLRHGRFLVGDPAAPAEVTLRELPSEVLLAIHSEPHGLFPAVGLSADTCAPERRAERVLGRLRDEIAKIRAVAPHLGDAMRRCVKARRDGDQVLVWYAPDGRGPVIRTGNLAGIRAFADASEHSAGSDKPEGAWASKHRI